MVVFEKGGPSALRIAGVRPVPAPDVEIAALRGALKLETRLAEALAARSRGLIEVVEALSHRALAESRDIEEARARLADLSVRMRSALEAGEAARPDCLAQLAERTLSVFEVGEGPRIVCEGPQVSLSGDAARLVALTLFELASRSMRHGALTLPDGRASVGWSVQAGGGLRLFWREYGAGTASEALRGGVGGALLPLLSEQFGAPLRVKVTPFGLRAELTVPLTGLAPSDVAGLGVVLRLDPSRGAANAEADAACAAATTDQMPVSERPAPGEGSSST
jgi:two-component sensor histidine kinase